MAGAETILSALWRIPDKATARFMQEYYLNTGENYPEKLRRIQLKQIADLRNQGLADHPYNWGAFISLGDWK